MKLKRQNREGDSPCSDHMERGLDLGCLIALRCESARRQSRSKIFKVKKIFNFFSKRVFPMAMFQDPWIIKSEKNFSDFQTNLSPRIAMRSQRQKLPLTCYQRRRTLPVPCSDHMERGLDLRCLIASLRVRVEVKNLLS